jgi:hypothetical protein
MDSTNILIFQYFCPICGEREFVLRQNIYVENRNKIKELEGGET